MSAARATACYAAALALSKGLTLVTLPVLTAHLPPEDFARLDLLASAAEIAALLAGAGMVDTLYRFGRESFATLMGLALTIAFGVAGLAWLAAPAIAPLLPLPVAPDEIRLLGLAVASGPLVALPMALLRMTGRALPWAAVEGGRAVLQAGAAVVLVIGGFGVGGVLGGTAAGAAAAALLLFAIVGRREGIALAPRGWGAMLAYGLPLSAGGLFAFALGTADRWFLASAVPAAALADYALAAKIALVAALLTQPFELWWYPRRLALIQAPGGAAETARMVGIGGALVVLSAAGAAVAGPVLIRLLTPAAYHGAVAWVPFLCAAIALQSLGSLVNVGCYTGRTGARPMAVTAAAAVVAVVLYGLLIPAFGVAGAIAATLAAQSVRFAGFLALSQRAAPVAYPLGSLAVLAAAGTALAALGQLPGLGMVVAAGAAGFALLALLAMRLGLLPALRPGVLIPVRVHG